MRKKAQERVNPRLCRGEGKPSPGVSPYLDFLTESPQRSISCISKHSKMSPTLMSENFSRRNAALVAAGDFLHAVLEALEGGDLAFVDHDAVAHQAQLGVAGDLALR